MANFVFVSATQADTKCAFACMKGSRKLSILAMTIFPAYLCTE